jgi:hypothetical protein
MTELAAVPHRVLLVREDDLGKPLIFASML